MIETIEILGVKVHNLTMSTTLERMEEFIHTKQPHIICTPNIDYIIQAQGDHELKRILNEADLSIPDGMGVVRGSWILGKPLLGNVGGRLVVPRFCELAARKGYTVYLLGSRPGIADKAGENLKREFPNLRIVGTHHGYFTKEEEKELIVDIRELRPDALFIAFGTPMQEKWMSEHAMELNVPILMGIGSTFDRISGVRKIPPTWMTDVGLECLYRLFQEPKRLGKKHLLEDPVFFYLILKDRVKNSYHRHEVREKRDVR